MQDNNNEDEDVTSAMVTEGPHGDKLSYDGVPLYCPTCKKPIESKDNPWGPCPHCGAQH